MAVRGVDDRRGNGDRAVGDGRFASDHPEQGQPPAAAGASFAERGVAEAIGDVSRTRIIDGTGNRVWPKMGSVDIQADNGVIHVVKEVLSPPTDRYVNLGR